jgi:hypothetical protein
MRRLALSADTGAQQRRFPLAQCWLPQWCRRGVLSSMLVFGHGASQFSSRCCHRARPIDAYCCCARVRLSARAEGHRGLSATDCDLSARANLDKQSQHPASSAGVSSSMGGRTTRAVKLAPSTYEWPSQWARLPKHLPENSRSRRRVAAGVSWAVAERGPCC